MERATWCPVSWKALHRCQDALHSCSAQKWWIPWTRCLQYCQYEKRELKEWSWFWLNSWPEVFMDLTCRNFVFLYFSMIVVIWPLMPCKCFFFLPCEYFYVPSKLKHVTWLFSSSSCWNELLMKEKQLKSCASLFFFYKCIMKSRLNARIIKQ